MDKDSNLLVLEQRIINKYLTYHLGHRVCAFESDSLAIGSQFIPYEKKFIKIKEEKVMYSWRKLSHLIQHNAKDMFYSHIKNIEKDEIILSGDYGKGAFICIGTVIMRYTNDQHAAFIQEHQIGEI